jgi:hypothetical protein
VFIVDDPMLALITRFIVDIEHLDVSDREYLQAQLRSIQAFVDQYPADQRQQRALEWIESHAKEYRVAWQRRMVSSQLTKRRCRDCPLVERDASRHCDVHAQWSRLLQDYVGDRISSRQYVQSALDLLHAHKLELKVGPSATGEV